MYMVPAVIRIELLRWTKHCEEFLTSDRDGGREHALSSGSIHSIRQELFGSSLFVGTIWLSFFLSQVTSIGDWGLVPRKLVGLVGIGTMTFLHGNFQHLIGNTIPLFVLLSLLAGSRARTWWVVTLISVFGGGLLWLFGRSGSHQGASLLIFGLISYLIASGLYFERRILPMMVAFLVVFTYGFTLLSGILPQFGELGAVSWEGHMCGAIAGVLAAYLARTRQPASLTSKAEAGATQVDFPKT